MYSHIANTGKIVAPINIRVYSTTVKTASKKMFLIKDGAKNLRRAKIQNIISSMMPIKTPWL
jgi:hypothetical protein